MRQGEYVGFIRPEHYSPHHEPPPRSGSPAPHGCRRAHLRRGRPRPPRQPDLQAGLGDPGGYLHPGETPSEGAARELKEELGLTTPIGRLLVADWAPHPSGGDKLLFVFDGGLITDTDRARITPDGVEIGEYAFYDEDQLDTVLIPRLARRIHAAFAARANRRTVYLENGEPA